jgi:hypothetical protein
MPTNLKEIRPKIRRLASAAVTWASDLLEIGPSRAGLADGLAETRGNALRAVGDDGAHREDDSDDGGCGEEKKHEHGVPLRLRAWWYF